MLRAWSFNEATTRPNNKSAQPQIRASLEGKPAKGLTVSPTTGEAAEDSVKPIFAGDKIVGTLKVGSYFSHATAEQLKERTGFQIVFMYGGKVTASTFGKDAQIALPPETIKAVSGGTPTATDFAVADKPYRARLVYLASDVGEGMTIAFVSDLSRVEAEKSEFAWSLGWKCLVALLVILPLAFFGAHVATRQLLRLAAAMRELATGRLDVILPGLNRKDEVGDIAKAVENFKIIAVEKVKAEQEQRSALDEQAASDRKRGMQKLANEFEGAVGNIIQAVSSNATAAMGLLAR
jgi:methyl-accepting chemotaxis protein